MVTIGIEHQGDGVVSSESAVALHGVYGDARRFGVVTDDSKVEAVLVDKDLDVGGIRCWCAWMRVLLDQVWQGFSEIPGRLIESPVHRNGCVGGSCVPYRRALRLDCCDEHRKSKDEVVHSRAVGERRWWMGGCLRVCVECATWGDELRGLGRPFLRTRVRLKGNAWVRQGMILANLFAAGTQRQAPLCQWVE